MSEVSGRTVGLVGFTLRHRGIDLGPLVEGLPLGVGALEAPGQATDWDTFIELMDRAERALGGPEGMRRLWVPGAGVRTGHAFAAMARVFTPSALYELLARWGLASSISVLSARCEAVSAGELRFVVDIDPTRRGGASLLHFLEGMLRALPHLVDCPPSEVVGTVGAHEAAWSIRLPPDPGWLGRVRRSLGLLGGARAALDELGAQRDEIRAQNARLASQLEELRVTQAALAASEAELRTALDAAKMGTWRWLPDTREAQRSPRVAALYGVTPERLAATPDAVLEFVHPEDRPAQAELIERILSGPAGVPVENEFRVVWPDGSVHWLAGRGTLVKGGGGQPDVVTGTLLDVTERRELAAQLELATRMAALGTLAAGVAHELNNPLAYVSGHLDRLLRSLGALTRRSAEGQAWSREVTDSVDAIVDGVSRIRSIVRDLKTFSRPDPEHRAPVQLRAVVDAAVRLGAADLRHRAVVVRRDDDLPPVPANEARLAQVVLNLLVNAVQAMPERPASQNRIEVATYADGGMAVLEVRDNGMGMPEGVRARLFDPFFTTKAVGQGTGLGLSVCHGIVQAHGGSIEALSRVGEGSTFRVRLPFAGRISSAPPPSPPRVAARVLEVLLVDDEPLIRSVMASLLGDHGHRVEMAASGAEALERVGARPCDVVVCDLMMPGMTGMEVHARLVAEHPALAQRTVFVTGGAYTEAARAFLDRERPLQLDKPFTVDQLLEAVDRAAG